MLSKQVRVRMQRDVDKRVKWITQLARPTYNSSNPDVLSRRYGLELARLSRVLSREPREGV